MPDPQGVNEILRVYADGQLSAPIAAMRLLMACEDSEHARGVLSCALQIVDAAQRSSTTPGMCPEGNDATIDRERRLRRLADLLASKACAWDNVHGVIGTVEHKRPAADSVSYWASRFDAALHVSPEASVALYSLGDPQILAAATAEISALLEDWSLLGRERSVVDVGCGIGRLEVALSPRVKSIVGIDIAPAMLAEARGRCSSLSNVRFVLGSGYDLAVVGDETADLVVYVDSFPYLVLSGNRLAARHVAESVRVLRPGGDLLILNFSYRDDLGTDTAELASFAGASGLQVRRTVARPLQLWDAPAFHLVKRWT